MSEPLHTSERRPAIRPGVIVASLAALLIVAAVIYFAFIHERGPRPVKLALITWTQDPFWQPLLRGAQDQAKQSNVDLTIVQSEPTVEAQTQHIRRLLDSGIDGLAISPNNVAAQQAILDEATAKLPVVTFDTDAPQTKRRRFVGIDNYAAGRLAAGEMRDALPDGGAILISVGSIEQQHGRERRQGVIDDLLERGFNRTRDADPIDAPLRSSRFTIITAATDDGSPTKAVETIAAALKAHPEIKGIIGLYSYSAPAAVTAIKQAGFAGPVQIIGFDESIETQAALEAGTIHSSLLQDSYRAGSETIAVLADEARGVPPGVADDGSTRYVGINVYFRDDLESLRKTGSIRSPTGTPTTQAADAR